MNVTRIGRIPALIGALLLGAAPTPAARANDALSILSLTPTSGELHVVPGGDAATPASLTPSNTVVAHVVFPTAESYEKFQTIWVGASSIPPMAPSGQQVPRLILKPFQKAPVTGRGPVRATVEFGYACYPNSMPEITLTSFSIAGIKGPADGPDYVVGGKTPVNLVIRCGISSHKPPVGAKPPR